MQKMSFFSTGKTVLGQLPPEENFPSILALTLKLTQTQTPTRGWQFSFGGNCPDTGKNKRNKKPKRNKKQKNKEKINKTNNGKFYQIKKTFFEK